MKGYIVKSFTYIVDDKRLISDEPFGEKYREFMDSLTNEQKERLQRITTTVRVDYPHSNCNAWY